MESVLNKTAWITAYRNKPLSYAFLLRKKIQWADRDGAIRDITLAAFFVRVWPVKVRLESFPTLSRSYSKKEFRQDMVTDPVHRANFESGALLSRTRSTAVPKAYHLIYPALSDSDKELLEAWELDSIGYGGAAFTWYDYKAQKLYVAKLLDPISYAIHPQSAGDLWEARLDLAILREA